MGGFDHSSLTLRGEGKGEEWNGVGDADWSVEFRNGCFSLLGCHEVSRWTDGKIAGNRGCLYLMMDHDVGKRSKTAKKDKGKAGLRARSFDDIASLVS
jgi:hypothetical protein